MAGKIRTMIDTIIEKRACGKQALVNIVKTKLILKGIRPDIYSASSEDDPLVVNKLTEMAKEMGIIL